MKDWLALVDAVVSEAPEVVESARVPLRECRSTVQLYCAEGAPPESEGEEFDEDDSVQAVDSPEARDGIECGDRSGNDGSTPWVPIPGGGPTTRAEARRQREAAEGDDVDDMRVEGVGILPSFFSG